MRILLLGEFSGFFTNLSDGLIELGHEVKLVSNGDSWKQISPSSIKLFSHNSNKIINYLEGKYLRFKNLKKLANFDVVQIVSPNIFDFRFNRNINLLKKIRKMNSSFFLSVAGDHFYIHEIYKKLRYGVPFNPLIQNNPYYKLNNDLVIQLSNGLIPVLFTYAESYRNSDKLLKTIPLPINIDKISFSDQTFKNNRITVFHGINRVNEKGSELIINALNKLRDKYPNIVDIVIQERIPLAQYLKVLSTVNIVIDQCNSYEYGMNALYSMAMGKVVLSGNEPECQSEFNRFDIPVINILPNSEQIFNKLEKLILDKDSIVRIGKKSREFVEDFHHYKKIAKLYIDEWLNFKK